eukprot:gnl/TRDRNA2_/TRDRNA2_150851_c0_seq1.p1 gnl/TRDRNA2_/TRDRNA2_150851_c0~~gnl/TRDRNA2_/TRDRNA2_150851_c0_seq1.p1  ORF type:complete len:791 (+),score=150.90 gnl/TRDRNA2_/TRDRNA2_150851_c0_seq1:78-2450(+)
MVHWLQLAGGASGHVPLAVAVVVNAVICRAQNLPLPEVPYEFEDLEPYLNGVDCRRHHQEVFGHYVKRFNAVLGLIRHTPAYRKILKHGGIDGLLRRIDEVPKALQQQLRRDGGGYVNHELFFRTLRPGPRDPTEAGNVPQGALLSAIERSFGTFDAFQNEFNSIARQAFGSGWAWLVGDAAGSGEEVDGGNHSGDSGAFWLRIVETKDNDHPLLVSGSYVPLLCLDLWEHAYFGQFRNDRRRYIEAWWNVVNWQEVESILAAADLEVRLSGATSPRLDFASDAIAEVGDGPPASLASSGSFSAAAPVLSGEHFDHWDVPAPPSPTGSTTRNNCGAITSFLERLSGEVAPGIRCNYSEVRFAVSSKLETVEAGDVLFAWPAEYLLGARAGLRQRLHQGAGDEDGGLRDLVVALLAENRRADGAWHEYVEYLHQEFELVRRGALFWPQALLRALNETVGLGDLHSAMRAHRGAAEFFDKVAPDLLQPTPNSQESTQPLFEAEIHWAVAIALCRAVWDANSSTSWMVPGSELLTPGDARTANVVMRRRAEDETQTAAAGSPGAWELVATRAVSLGDALVVDAGMSNEELLARGWSALGGNLHGPVLHLPTLDEEVVKHAAGLAAQTDAAGSSQSELSSAQPAGAKFRHWDCATKLSKPRLSRVEATIFSRALVLCIVYTIRLLEASQASLPAGADSEDGTAPQVSSKADVLHSAYALIGQACENEQLRHRAALAWIPTTDGSMNPSEEAIAESLREALSADTALLEECVAHAQRHSAKVLAQAEASSLEMGQ